MKIIKVNLTVMFLLFFSCSTTKHIHNTNAKYVGGKEKMFEYFKANNRWVQRQGTIQGFVLVSFTVNKTGEVMNTKVIKKLCTTCDKEALRLVRNMPNWIPANIDGKNVNSEITVSIRFGI